MKHIGNYRGLDIYEKSENGEKVVTAYLDTPDGIFPCGIQANSVEEVQLQIDNKSKLW